MQILTSSLFACAPLLRAIQYLVRSDLPYARQFIIRESNLTERNLITRCNVINSVRSDNNPHGFTIEAFEVVENRNIRVINR